MLLNSLIVSNMVIGTVQLVCTPEGGGALGIAYSMPRGEMGRGRGGGKRQCGCTQVDDVFSPQPEGVEPPVEAT